MKIKVYKMNYRDDQTIGVIDKTGSFQQVLRSVFLDRQIGQVRRNNRATCMCGKYECIVNMYRCYFCGVWFCFECMKLHLGQSVQEYHKSKGNSEE